MDDNDKKEGARETMARLMITNTHGWTPTDLRKQEKQERNVHLRIQLTAVRLIMEGRMGVEVAALCNPHRQSVSTYVKKI
jgi:hypothetical protein